MRLTRLAGTLVTLVLATFIQAAPTDCISILSGVVTSSSAAFSSDAAAFNQRLEPIPAAIVYPTSPAEVSAALLCASNAGLNVSARSGGHSYASYSISGSGLVVDLKAFRSIVVNSDGTATVGAGNRLGDVALALSTTGRAIPHGTCPMVGIGGHAGMGGFGLSSRMWGLTLDNILAVDVVLANGTIVPNLSSRIDPDLFWAIRGSASSFVIVTSFTFKTHAAPTNSITNFAFAYDATLSSTVAAAFSAFQSFGAGDVAPELSLAFKMGNGGAFSFGGMYYGDPSTFDETLEPFILLLPDGFGLSSSQMNWTESIIKTADGLALNTTGVTDRRDDFYAKSILTPSGTPITLDVLETFFAYLANSSTTTEWFVEVNLVGGTRSAINNASLLDTTSFAHRDSLLLFQLYASSSTYGPPYPAAGLTFVQGMYDLIVNPMMSSWGSTWGSYVNYVDPNLSQDDVRTLYWGTQYDRLATLKSRYDPSNLFTNPQSIVGSATNASGTSTAGTASASGKGSSGAGRAGAGGGETFGAVGLGLLALLSVAGL